MLSTFDGRIPLDACAEGGIVGIIEKEVVYADLGSDALLAQGRMGVKKCQFVAGGDV